MKFLVGGLIDKCENCGFKALLYLKTMVRQSDLDILPDDDNMVRGGRIDLPKTAIPLVVRKRT